MLAPGARLTSEPSVSTSSVRSLVKVSTEQPNSGYLAPMSCLNCFTNRCPLRAYAAQPGDTSAPIFCGFGRVRSCCNITYLNPQLQRGSPRSVYGHNVSVLDGCKCFGCSPRGGSGMIALPPSAMIDRAQTESSTFQRLVLRSR